MSWTVLLAKDIAAFASTVVRDIKNPRMRGDVVEFLTISAIILIVTIFTMFTSVIGIIEIGKYLVY